MLLYKLREFFTNQTQYPSVIFRRHYHNLFCLYDENLYYIITSVMANTIIDKTLSPVRLTLGSLLIEHLALGLCCYAVITVIQVPQIYVSGQHDLEGRDAQP